MANIQRTVAAAIVGFAVGAGAVGGGFYAYSQLDPGLQAQQNAGATINQYAQVASSPVNSPMGSNSVSNVVKRVSPAIVKIVATVKERVNVNNSSSVNPFFGSLFGGQTAPETEIETDIGTGFFFNSHGYLVTNDHVIYGADNIKVYVHGYSTPFTAHVVGSDYQTDLAVLKISAPKPLPTLVLGNSTKTPVGAWVVAIGNPYDLSDHRHGRRYQRQGTPLNHWRTQLRQPTANVGADQSGQQRRSLNESGRTGGRH